MSVDHSETIALRKSRVVAFSFLLISCLLCGANSSIVKLSSLGSFGFLFWCNAITFPVFILGFFLEILAARPTTVTPAALPSNGPAQRSTSWPTKSTMVGIAWAVASGIAAGVGNALGLTALKSSSVAVASFLVSLQVVLTPLISYFALRERLPVLFYVGVTMTVAGVVFVVWGQTLTSSFVVELLPDLVALLASIFIAMSSVLMKKATPHLGTMSIVLVMTSTILVVLSLADLSPDISVFTLPSGTVQWVLVLLGAAISLLPPVAVSYALHHLSVSLVGVTTAAQDISSSVFAYLILDERLVWMELVGLGVGVAGIAVSSASGRELSGMCGKGADPAIQREESAHKDTGERQQAEESGGSLLEPGFVQSSEADPVSLV